MVGSSQSDVETIHWFKPWRRRVSRRHLHYAGPRRASAMQLFVSGIVDGIDARFYGR